MAASDKLVALVFFVFFVIAVCMDGINVAVKGSVTAESIKDVVWPPKVAAEAIVQWCQDADPVCLFRQPIYRSLRSLLVDFFTYVLFDDLDPLCQPTLDSYCCILLSLPLFSVLFGCHLCLPVCSVLINVMTPFFGFQRQASSSSVDAWLMDV